MLNAFLAEGVGKSCESRKRAASATFYNKVLVRVSELPQTNGVPAKPCVSRGERSDVNDRARTAKLTKRKRTVISLRVDKEVFYHLFYFFPWGIRGLLLKNKPMQIGFELENIYFPPACYGMRHRYPLKKRRLFSGLFLLVRQTGIYLTAFST